MNNILDEMNATAANNAVLRAEVTRLQKLLGKLAAGLDADARVFEIDGHVEAARACRANAAEAREAEGRKA